MLECVATLTALVQYSSGHGCNNENRQFSRAAFRTCNPVELQDNRELRLVTQADQQSIARSLAGIFQGSAFRLRRNLQVRRDFQTISRLCQDSA